ncbi:hypothetical protein RRF57_012657 [Xylaria bambusicola]|uniref:Uncharacterized protein n=1 Tax=Xylaria bambusicola TaxID=326684 RepID=A0AAN7UQ10_9PEZI
MPSRSPLGVALSKADDNPYLEGWRANDVRERGRAAQFSGLGSKQDRSFTHADFSRITAFLSYDFASILHLAYEFFSSFSTIGGQLSGWLCDGTPNQREAAALRSAKLTGLYPSSLPVSVASGNAGVDWEIAQSWEEELRKLDVKRPSSIQEIEKIANVDELLSCLKPWMLTNQDYSRLNLKGDHRWDLGRRGKNSS